MNCGSCASARQQRELTLAAGNHGVGPIAQIHDAEAFHGPRRHRAVGRARPGEQIAVRGAPHQDDRLHREGESREVRLRHVGDQPGALAARVARQRPPAEFDCAFLGWDEAEQSFQQRRLAAAVGSQQRQHLAGGKRDVEVAADDSLAVADR
jgi:single-stranded DNA-binding protein